MKFKKVPYQILLNREITGYYLKIIYCDKNNYPKIVAGVCVVAEVYYVSSKNKKMCVCLIEGKYNTHATLQDIFKFLIKRKLKIVKNDQENYDITYFTRLNQPECKYFYLKSNIYDFISEHYTNFVTQFPEVLL